MSEIYSAVAADINDLRDRIYTPSLRPLLPRVTPSEVIIRMLRDPTALPCLPRDQGSEGSCASQALAALIDLQKTFSNDATADFSPVSARMLSTMGERHSERLNRSVSLRDVIKGFYHNGVCGNDIWPYAAGLLDDVLDVRRSKAARSVCLGAYFRLRPTLNDYHSAINEVGPILVSAGIHEGWQTGVVRRHAGRIVPSVELDGGHAFVIVGYDQEGFLVLNSWGPNWGGFDGCKGVGHWSYADWADNIMDGWVLRLGVATPSVFPLSIGEQGIYFNAPHLPVHSTPAHEVAGHLLHLDDGELVDKAPYASSPRSVAETIRFLRRVKDREDDPVALQWEPGVGEMRAQGYRGLALKIGGSLQGLGQMADIVASEKKLAKDVGLYPIALAWCNDAVEETDRVLTQMFSAAEAQVGKRGSDLDRLIELRTHGIGRAFWRDVESAASKSARIGGPIHSLLRELLRLDHYSLHIICEGSGALVLANFMKLTKKSDKRTHDKLCSTIASLDLVTPAIDASRFRETCRDLLSHSLGKRRCARLHVPSERVESGLRVGPYGRPILTLVENSFSSRSEAKPNMLGKATASLRRRDPQALEDVGEYLAICEIEVNESRPLPTTQQQLLTESGLMQKIFRLIDSNLNSGGEQHGRKDHIATTER